MGYVCVPPSRVKTEKEELRLNETILVVDDEASIADLVEVYLKNEGFRVMKCGNGATGFAPGAGERRLIWPFWT